jgi:hypothetical protein
VPCRRVAGRHFSLAGENCRRLVRLPTILAGR